MRVRMYPREQELLSSYAARASRIVEYGCGGSTLLMLQSGKARVWSVESDPAWISALRQDEWIKPHLDTRLEFIRANLGPVKGWGTPTGSPELWPSYWTDVWDRVEDVDLVLVDGRFRVACSLFSAIKSEGVIMIHDYFRRPHYHVVQDHLDLQESSGQLACFTRRGDFSPISALRDLELFGYDVR